MNNGNNIGWNRSFLVGISCENDAILTFLGRDDCKYRVVARGVQKIGSKNAGALLPGNTVKLYTGAERKQDTSCNETGQGQRLSASYRRIFAETGGYLHSIVRQ